MTSAATPWQRPSVPSVYAPCMMRPGGGEDRSSSQAALGGEEQGGAGLVEAERVSGPTGEASPDKSGRPADLEEVLHDRLRAAAERSILRGAQEEAHVHQDIAHRQPNHQLRRVASIFLFPWARGGVGCSDEAVDGGILMNEIQAGSLPCKLVRGSSDSPDGDRISNARKA